MKPLVRVVLLGLLMLEPASSRAAPLATSFTYQGRLEDRGKPANGEYELSFNLCTDLTIGLTNGSFTVLNVGVSNGTFTALVDFGVTVFDGTAYWLELGVRTNGSSGPFTTLTPRQPLTPIPYALYAVSAGPGRPGNAISGSQATVGGGIQNESSGDYATVGGGNQNRGASPSATIAGGDGNRVELNGDWGAIGGGHQNKVLGQYAFIGGGDRNCANGSYAIIGAGIVNTNQGLAATIGGGRANFASGDFGTVSGGTSNRSLGLAATVAGGANNEATAAYSLAAGRRAKAANPGSFVWSDSSDADFSSTANNQFLIRAAGGVGIGKNNPASALDVNGTVSATAFNGSGVGLTGLNGSNLVSGTITSNQIAPAGIDLVNLAPQLVADALIPPGSIMPYMGTTAPPGWLLCDGSEVSRNTYARLFGIVGTASGSGNGSTTFNLPDMRGMFLRGVDGSAGRDPDKSGRTAAKPGGNSGPTVGSVEEDDFKSHTHRADPNFKFVEFCGNCGPSAGWMSAGSSIKYVPNTQPAGGNETRPKNVYVNYLIKY